MSSPATRRPDPNVPPAQAGPLHPLAVLRVLGDRAAGWALVGLGALALLLGYLGVKDTAYVAEQLPYVVSGGVLGLFLLGLGGTVLLSADLRDEWRTLVDVRDELHALRSDGSHETVQELLELHRRAATTPAPAVPAVPAVPAEPPVPPATATASRRRTRA